MEKMREIYPNTLRLEFWQEKKITAEEERESLKGLGFGELFERFFERQNGTKPNENEKNAAYEIYKKSVHLVGCPLFQLFLDLYILGNRCFNL